MDTTKEYHGGADLGAEATTPHLGRKPPRTQCVRKTCLESKTNLDYNQIFTKQLKEIMAFSGKYTIKGSEVYSLKK